MNRRWIITLLVCLLIVGSGAGVLLWPRTVPLAQCSEVYRLYVNNPSIRASFIKDFRINDTVSVDVTLLEATDSVGWATLKKDFEVLDPSPELQQLIDNGKDLVYLKLIPKASTVGPSPNTYPNDLLAVSHVNRTLNVFHVRNTTEDLAVRHYNYDKSTNQ